MPHQPALVNETKEVIVSVEENQALFKAVETDDRIEGMLNSGPVPVDTKIFSVPSILSTDAKDFEKYFVPRLVALGPYHHNKSHLQRAEILKLRVAKEFIFESVLTPENGKKPTKVKILELYEIIEQEIKTLKKQYEGHESFTYDDKELAWMLFVDGCAVLYFIHHRVGYSDFDKLPVKRHHVAIANQDLFLLENQLPFRVLDLLMKKSKWFQGVDEGKLEKFIQRHIITADTEDEDRAHTEGKVPTHLLELLRTRSIKNQKGEATDSEQSPKLESKNFPSVTGTEGERRSISNSLQRAIKGTLAFLKTFFTKKERKSADWVSYRRAVELRARGIHLGPSKSNALNDVALKPHWFWFFKKVLYLPPITIDDWSKTKFLNLMADEMTSTNSNELEVSNYLLFLDLLIDEPEDVKELREANVIQNCLGSDKEVSDLFNEITKDLVINFEIYEGVKKDIEKHCSNKAITWMAQFFHEHFSSPWTIIAFFGVLFGLVLSILQTSYTINPRPQQCDGLCKALEKTLNIKK